MYRRRYSLLVENSKAGFKIKRIDKLKRGVCRKCGCTENNACYVSDIGTCWWVDDTKILCSHCFYNFYEKTLDEIEKEIEDENNNNRKSKRRSCKDNNYNEFRSGITRIR